MRGLKFKFKPCQLQNPLVDFKQTAASAARLPVSIIVVCTVKSPVSAERAIGEIRGVVVSWPVSDNQVLLPQAVTTQATTHVW